MNVTNYCKKGSNFYCERDPSVYAKDVLDEPIAVKMKDGGNGIYKATVTLPPRAGAITIPLYRMSVGGLYRECFDGEVLEGNHFASEVDFTINFNWTNDEVCKNRRNNVSIKWVGKLLSPVTRSVMFQTTVDNGANIYFDNTLVVEGWQWENTYSGTATLERNQFYDTIVDFFERGGLAYVNFKWDITGSYSIVPSEFLWYPSNTHIYAELNVTCKDRLYYYENSSEDCLECDFRCLKCSGPDVTDCIGCNNNKSGIALIDNVCSCDDRYILNEAEKRCDPGLSTDCEDPWCISCTGENFGDCIECVEDELELVPNNNKIYCGCPAGKYKGADNAYGSDVPFSCIECPVGTYTSQPGKDVCDECPPGKYNTMPGSISCDSNCHKICSKCFGDHSDQCLECNPEIPHLRLVQNTKCECEDGYYSDVAIPADEYCQPCPYFCTKCDKNTCFRCSSLEGVVLGSGECRCDPIGYFENLLDGDNRECLKCHSLCESCYGPSHNQCYSCNPQLNATLSKLPSEPATCKCPSHKYYDESRGTCEDCNILCTECSGPSYRKCSECNPSLSYKVADQSLCVTHCEFAGSYYLDYDTCKGIL
eukprot:TRINITY_DN727_c0_g1_i10.p1 TRINITY_DN727_c0_g1~~TRINITY_DN727_c0_g1_i10.p1  ORF type:complete len:593 (+),score=-14.24 TRINITY_DN727_c0_g1_i10:133-1911(+)